MLVREILVLFAYGPSKDLGRPLVSSLVSLDIPRYPHCLARAFTDCKRNADAWVKVLRINPEFRILRLTFHRKSASNAELDRF